MTNLLFDMKDFSPYFKLYSRDFITVSERDDSDIF